MANPIVTDMAMQYGQDLVGRGQEEIKKNLDKYVSLSQLKYYFAVDTTYVGRKIGMKSTLSPLFLYLSHSRQLTFSSILMLQQKMIIS
jgi:hypothetical protein